MKYPMKFPLPYYSESGRRVEYHHDGDAGLDLPIWDRKLWDGELSFDNSIILDPMDSVTLKTGVYLAIPDGCFGLLDSRSGTSKKRLDLLCRIIDSPFRGNMRLSIINLNKEPVKISNGDELFQIVIQEYAKATPIRLNSYEEFINFAGDTARGQDGFGSKERNKQEGK